ncbi:MAG: hypothetical protein ACHQO8_03120 [Vicinamibacterales bacterium]
MPSSRPSIELHIGELVLEGVPEADGYQVAEAVERQLTQLFTDRMAPAPVMQSRSVEAVDGGAVTITPGSSAGGLGQQVGSAIFKGVSR